MQMPQRAELKDKQNDDASIFSAKDHESLENSHADLRFNDYLPRVQANHSSLVIQSNENENGNRGEAGGGHRDSFFFTESLNDSTVINSSQVDIDRASQLKSSYLRLNMDQIRVNSNIINKTKKNFWAKLNQNPGFPSINDKNIRIGSIASNQIKKRVGAKIKL